MYSDAGNKPTPFSLKPNITEMYTRGTTIHIIVYSGAGMYSCLKRASWCNEFVTFFTLKKRLGHEYYLHIDYRWNLEMAKSYKKL